jgi:hypothetical protein
MNVAGVYKFKLEVTGSNGVTKTDYVTVNAGLYAEVGFVPLGTFPSDNMNFAPTNLPKGVTYILTDSEGNSWNSATGFTGQVTASEYYGEFDGGSVTYIQAFYLNGVEIIGDNSKRTVVLEVTPFFGGNFALLHSDTPSIKLKYQPSNNGTTPEAKTDGTTTTEMLSETLTVTLNGTSSTGATSYAWECVSYTANKGTVTTPYTANQVTGMIANANTATATVALRKAGTYVFKLTRERFYFGH